jgi:hypothetical protein
MTAEGAPAGLHDKGADFYAGVNIERAALSDALYLGATGAWRRSLYEKYGPIHPDSYEDLVMGFRGALEGRVQVVCEALVRYRLGGGVVSGGVRPTSFIAARRRRLTLWRGVLLQRLADAERFGLPPSSPVRRRLSASLLRTEISLALTVGDHGAFRRLALAAPFTALRAVLSERRRRWKFGRRQTGARDDG